ncbi:uncharacterized protein LOC143468631 [Clavelina lepadiformis]|uniref:uncharacterized protein LOC143468631 n=1 Tax=Clavelina lepadiformis TaxID=159417 RepID=UPI004041684D
MERHLLNLLCILIIAYAKTCEAIESLHDVDTLKESCTSAPALIIQNETKRLECCKEVSGSVNYYWLRRDYYLSRRLSTLQVLDCPQFEVECHNRPFAALPFTSLMYDRFCNLSNLIETCREKVQNPAVLDNEELLPFTLETWTKLTSSLNSSTLSFLQLQDPCIQVALYDSPSGSSGHYHELTPFSFFCTTMWCGFDEDSITRWQISSWAWMPTRCQINIAVVLIILVLLAFTITVGNVTIMWVYVSERKKLLNSQTIFRLGLAVVDLMVGVIVLPYGVWIFYQLYFNPIKVETLYNVTGKVNRENSFELVLEYREIIYTEDEILQSVAIHVIGFITDFSLFVSIFLLAISGVDRLNAIWRPLQYRKDKAKRFATIACVFIYSLLIVISSLPYLVASISYNGLMGSAIVIIYGHSYLTYYACVFVAPLVFTWVVSVAIYAVSRKNFKKRRHLFGNSRQNIAQQQRLNRTLGLMVSAFSFSVFPSLSFTWVWVLLSTDPPQDKLIYVPEAANIIQEVSVILLVSNSLWNCLIYSVRQKEFRQVATEKYRRLFRFPASLLIRAICGRLD